MNLIFRFFLPLACFFLVLTLLLIGFGNVKAPDSKLSGQKVEILNPGDVTLLPSGLKYLNPPKEVSRFSRYYDSKPIFNVLVEIDEWGNRKTPRLHSENAREHVIIAGCSNAFGSGLNIEETLVYMLEKQLPASNSYNFSISGGGLGTALDYVQKIDLSKIVKEDKGHFLYLFFQDHISRWLAKLPYLSWAPPTFPHYVVDDGSVILKGPLGELTSYKVVQIAKSLGLMNALIHAYHTFPVFYAYTMDDMRSYVSGIEELQKRYNNIYPEGNFHVVLFQFGTHKNILEMLTKLLDEKGIKYIDPAPAFEAYMKSQGLHVEDFIIPYDLHPNKKANEFLTDFLLERVIK